MSSSRSNRRRQRDYSNGPSPERRRRRRRRSRSSSREKSRSKRHSSSESDNHKKYHRRHHSSSSDASDDSDRYRRRGNSSKHGSHRHGNSSGRSRHRERERYRSRSRSPSAHRDTRKDRRRRSHSSERKRRRRHSTSSSRSRERTAPVKEKSEKHSSDIKKQSAAENLKAKVKALLAKSSEGKTDPSTVAEMSRDYEATPTPGQLSAIESNSFTADKFVSKRSSKKWDVPPSDIAQKMNTKSFDATTVDPSEFVPKVVPMCEVESALGRDGEGEVLGGEEGGRNLVSIKQKTEKEVEPLDRNQKWINKLKKMREKFANATTE